MRTITITSSREIEVNDRLADTLEAWMDDCNQHIVAAGDNVKEMYGEGWAEGNEEYWDDYTRRWAEVLQDIIDRLDDDEIYLFNYEKNVDSGDIVNVNDADFELD